MKQTTYRGKTFTDTDVLSAMERFDNEIRGSFPDKRWVTYAVKHNDKLYPPKELMRLVTGTQKVGSGGKPVNSRFEELGFKVTTLDDADISSAEADDSETTFSFEYDLENWLIANLEQLEQGLQLYQKNGATGQQYDAQVAGRIDILAIDSHDDFVVLELKAGEADRQVCGQIQGYMGWVRKNLAGTKKVRGIIVAGDFTERMVYAAEVVPGLRLKKYQVLFKFTDM